MYSFVSSEYCVGVKSFVMARDTDFESNRYFIKATNNLPKMLCVKTKLFPSPFFMNDTQICP